jgi:PKD repeat protein
MGTANVQLESGRTVSRYAWGWGNGDTANTVANTVSAKYVYTTSGEKNVSLTVTDDASETSAEYSQAIDVPTTLPIASFSGRVNKK